MTHPNRLTQARAIPVSFFSMAVGTLALAQAWGLATRLWSAPPEVALALSYIGLALWFILVLAYAAKWTFHRSAAQDELRHPVQSMLAALGPVATLLAAVVMQPLWRPAGWALLWLGLLAQLLLGLWIYGRFWQGGRAPETVSAAVYLPAVAQNFVAGMACAAYGWTEVGQLFFGAGAFSWLALESMVLSRASLHSAIAEAERPLLGIQLAPPVVGGVCYMSIHPEPSLLFAQMLLGYGLYQMALALRLLPWIVGHSFVPSYWAYSFGVVALSSLTMRMLEHGPTALLHALAPVLFIAANVVLVVLMVNTLRLLVLNQLVPVVQDTRDRP